MPATEGPSRVLIVEDHAMLAQGLGLVLRSEGYEIATAAADQISTLESVLGMAVDFRPDVVLLDLHLGPYLGDSTPLIQPLGSLGSTVIVVSGEEDPVALAMCIEAGAATVVDKGQQIDHVVSLVGRALSGESLLTHRRREELTAALTQYRRSEEERLRPFARLTPREREVLGHLMEGRSPQTVAAASYVSIATIRSQIRAILLKLQVVSQMEAVAMARRAGWAPSEADD